jgi:hypothetical protein
VYARTLKAGSEFFYKNFTQTANWQPCWYHEIDWSKDTVFSYIMDPIKRRHKGMSEVIIQTGTQDTLLNNTGNFANIIKQVPVLDAHSASLHNIYGSRVHDITWLLMTSDHSVAVEQTEELLATHNHPPMEWNSEFAHTTANYMDAVYNCVKSLWENDPSYDHPVRNYFQPDIDLYKRIQDQYYQTHAK